MKKFTIQLAISLLVMVIYSPQIIAEVSVLSVNNMNWDLVVGFEQIEGIPGKLAGTVHLSRTGYHLLLHQRPNPTAECLLLLSSDV